MSPTPIPLVAPVADEQRWAAIVATAPTMAATMLAYLDQVAVSLRPRSVEAADNALRSLATYLVGEPRLRRLKGLRRDHVEGYKLWPAQRPVGRGKTISARTVRHRLGMLRVFFERIIDWGWDDAPKSCPILQADLPRVNDPLPRFLDDAQAAALMRAAAVAEPLDRLVVETLARTGLRVGELCALEANAVVLIGATQWLRVPVGKLRNDRYLPLHPVLVELLDGWRVDHAHDALLITRPDGRPLTRDVFGRIVRRVARSACIVGAVTPHRLRHTLATQAVNRGMSLEAIAALLGHRSLRMTLVYARIADRKVADEYFTFSEQVEALYTAESPSLPTSAEGERMRRLRLEMQRRLLGNGYCTRPVELDCAFETVCETCVHFHRHRVRPRLVAPARPRRRAQPHPSRYRLRRAARTPQGARWRTLADMPVRPELDRITGISAVRACRATLGERHSGRPISGVPHATSGRDGQRFARRNGARREAVARDRPSRRSRANGEFGSRSSLSGFAARLVGQRRLARRVQLIAGS